MKILVTGGAGFIGSHVADAYIKMGHEVVIVDNLSMGRVENVNPQAHFVKMNIQDDQILKLFESERFDVVNHHAAQMDVRLSVADPIYDANNNIIGTINLLQAAVKTGVKKFIFISSGGAIYGEQDYFPADENHPTRPVSPYGITKLTGEKYLYFYHYVYGIQFVVLRYGNVYGPRQNPKGEAGVVAIFTSRMLNGSQPIINGNGLQTRDYVFVGDVVDANVKALSFDQCDYFNIGTGIETNVNELFHKLRHLTNANVEEVHGPAKPGEQMRSVLNIEKAQRLLQWRPQVSLEEGLARTVEYFKSNFKNDESKSSRKPIR
ncbi:MAG: GDP-mannose 4,6-dehydratase [candidate division KSB1 bacterium]|nr:GDP-mannose 4,6-dehydratase [candidate division KSB1 bacterium]MDZ7334951.1 GDP-mannose 4,6-dehydratase [candidate division KSB1 bacterium]MDZ7358442.1 GDP-mannose 4,6-dehydratase [candidate division KSB1 bacterium]MDZ7375028.1 GDP-mannose 4,6-dehydratase [candidate division KSB1 bacterium]MDZ7401723.1 GDP-mannose 4,6-dehydratase [candidate division KSB1 bacterium]